MVVQMAYSIPGQIMEFGVAQGNSTRVIRRTLSRCESVWHESPKKKIYACDSFEGLQERYENAEVGAFACEVPQIPGVHIVKGFYDQTLTPELANEIGKVSFASLDADLYSSTLTVLRWLGPLLGSGSLLLFDEFLGEKESEKRAFEDWKQESGIETILLAHLLRDPSAWGENLDARELHQVVRKEPLQRENQGPYLPDRISGVARRARKRLYKVYSS